LMDSKTHELDWVLTEYGKDGLEIGLSMSPFSEISELGQVAELGVPVVLSITGKGVVTKRLARTVGAEDEQARQFVSEYGNTEVCHTLSVQGSWCHVSILRKDIVEEWLQ